MIGMASVLSHESMSSEAMAQYASGALGRKSRDPRQAWACGQALGGSLQARCSQRRLMSREAKCWALSWRLARPALSPRSEGQNPDWQALFSFLGDARKPSSFEQL